MTRVLAMSLLLWATSAQALTVKLAWDAATTGGVPENYVMYRKVGNGQFELLATIPVPTLTYTDNTAVLGLQCYHVTATNAGGESSPSNEACFQAVEKPGAPGQLRLVP
jgi:hypothetical protein